MAGWILKVIAMPVVPFSAGRRAPPATPRGIIGSIAENERDTVDPEGVIQGLAVQGEDDELDVEVGGPQVAEPPDGIGGVEPDVAGGLVVAMATVELPARLRERFAVPGAADAAAREHRELADVVRVVFHRRLGAGIRQ